MITHQQEIPIDFKADIYQILVLKAEETHISISELVNEAIKWYFSGVFEPLTSQYSDEFIQEARRQSLLVSQRTEPSSDMWEANIDTSEWRG